jgi:predicted Zn-dependent protease with MMP-like domain
VLLGTARQASGDPNGAVDVFRRAVEAGPNDHEALLALGNALLNTDGAEPVEGLALIERAIAASPDEQARSESLLIKAESLLALGDRDEQAFAAVDGIPPLEDPELQLRAAHVYFELGRLDRAQEKAAQVLSKDSKDADALYLLGLIYESQGLTGPMTSAWLEVRELDLAEADPPWALEMEAFSDIAERAIASLPEEIHRHLANVPVLVEEYPEAHIVEEGFEPRLLGFFSGVPLPDQMHVGGPIGHLECVILFKRNIERDAMDAEEIAEQIQITVLHETAHFFGLSDDDLEKIGLG